MSTDKRDSLEAAQDESQRTSSKKPYQAPAIVEEEVFESFAMGCSHVAGQSPQCNQNSNS